MIKSKKEKRNEARKNFEALKAQKKQKRDSSIQAKANTPKTKASKPVGKVKKGKKQDYKRGSCI